ncbi:hypothetical protein RB596_004372 [Gaeumannomyces avenae]
MASLDGNWEVSQNVALVHFVHFVHLVAYPNKENMDDEGGMQPRGSLTGPIFAGEMEASSTEPILRVSEIGENWDTDAFWEEDLAGAVEILHLCTLRNDNNEGDENGEPPTNHWTMSLQTSPTSCVTLDMAPGYGSEGIRGKIELASLPTQPYNTDETLRTFSFRPARTVTIADIIQSINGKGRDAFDFSPEWEGCRAWLAIVMGDLEKEGIVSQGSTAEAKDALLMYWRNPEGFEPRVMKEGNFRSSFRELGRGARYIGGT